MNEDQLLPEDQNIDTNDDTELDGEAELIAALKSLNAEPEDDDDDIEYDDSDDDDIEDDIDDIDEDDEEFDSEDELDEDSDETKGRKREQSREENARFAAQRRQQELDNRVQAELERLKQESPEFLLSKQLSEVYGIPPEEIIKQMKEAKLKEESEKLNVPLKMLQEREVERERLTQVETELNQLRFERWETRIDTEASVLKDTFKMLDQNDIEEAKSYILNVARNVDMPLEQAVYALHGKKIIDSMGKEKVQEDLAAQSGRKKKTPLAPNGGKPKQTTSLTADEAYIAKMYGMTAEEYQKYKS